MKRDLDLLYEMGTIRHIQRMWRRFLNADFANLAEHHFRVAWIALVIAKREGVENTDKILKMALAHDIAESRTGDVDQLSRQYVDRNEELGLKDILEETSLGEEMLALMQEYEERQTIEAKIVKDADNLDCDFELHEQAARGMDFPKHYYQQKIRKTVFTDKLYTPTARAMWQEMQYSDPHNWHFSSRNRLSHGDWKK
jgi:putative hydrolase of HD superfamily